MVASTLAACTPPARDEAQTLDSGPEGTSRYGGYLAGSLAVRHGEFGVARRYLERALAQDPENSDLLRQTFLVTVGQGEIAAAGELARRVVMLEPNDLPANMVLALEDIRAERYPAAESRLQALPRSGLNNLLLPLVRSWIAAGRRDAVAAYGQLRPLAENSNFAMLAELHRGLIADYLDDRAVAEDTYADLLRADPTPPYRLTVILGNYYERYGKPERARRIYDDFIDSAPETLLLAPALARLNTGKLPAAEIPTVASGIAEALFDIAFLIQRERPGDVLALTNVQLALSMQRDFAIAQMLLGDIYEAQNRPREALAVYQSIAVDSPFRWSSRLRGAYQLDQLGKTDRAVAELRAMSAEQPARVDVLAQLGDILRQHERFLEAVTAYDQALSRVKTIERRHWSLLFSRAIALERSKQIDRAVADLKQAIDLEPDEPYLLNYLGYTWVERGLHLDQAQAMIERAVLLKPNDGSIVDSLGWVHYMRGDFDKAVFHLERAAELKPHDATVNDHLGDAYWHVGRRQEAQTQWQRALSLDADPALRAAIEKKLKSGVEMPKTAETRP